MQPIHNQSAIDGCQAALDRCLALTQLYTVEQYVAQCPDDGRPDGGRSDGSIGAHIRHVVEHLTCFFDGLARGCIDYDARARDEHVERDPTRARALLERARAELDGLRARPLDSSVRVVQVPALDTPSIEVTSSVARELLFLSSHTIHHLALIKLLARQQGYAFPASFDVAYSTAQYRASTTSCVAEVVNVAMANGPRRAAR
ncbi:MAG: DinB family protein [Planctomycetota bacterium]